MENQTLVVLDGNQVDVDILEQDVADAVVRAYGSERRYSQALNLLFPVGSLSTDWFTLRLPIHQTTLRRFGLVKNHFMQSSRRQSIRTLRRFTLESVSMVPRTDMVRPKAKVPKVPKAKVVLSGMLLLVT
jgi:hypothetical protein